MACPSGKFNENRRSITEDDCKLCPADKYGDKEGLSVCTECPRGQIQPAEGKVECQPCKVEHPVLMSAAESYGPNGVHFVAVLYQDDAAKARAFLNRSGSHWPTLEDPGGRTAIAYGVAGVPETFFIDQTGTIVRKVAGPVSQDIMVSTLEQML